MPLNEDTLSRLGAEVDLPKIDHALKQLWEQDEAKTRASLINFAIYTEDAKSLSANSKILDDLTADHACRALLILCLPDEPRQKARAWINALCRPYQGKQVVCSEQISFVLEGGDGTQIQNIVFAHLDSDLPLIVWWQGDISKHFEERFYSRIGTLIIDSSRWADPKAEFAALSAVRSGETARFDVRDLSWTRTHFLRTALATCFQDANALSQLPLVNLIEISYAKGHRCSALLLAGWIAVRLQYTLNEDHSEIAFKKANGDHVSVKLTEKADGYAVQALTISGPDLRASVSREGGSAFVHLCASCNGHGHDEVLPADVETEADLISEQLSRTGGNTHYTSVLALIGPLLGH